MRFAEIENGRVRYVLPAELAEEYQILTPCAVEIPLDSSLAEGDVYDQAAVDAVSLAAFRAKRDRLFAETEWVRQRHSDHVDMAVDDEVNWDAWLDYWQGLRDMPGQEGFDAGSPVWPEKPE